jgi:hypothetical protein
MAAAYPTGRPSIPALAWQRYLASLRTHPLKTKALTSAAISGLSDVIAQGIIRSRGSNVPHNWRRTLLLAVYGLVWWVGQQCLQWLAQGSFVVVR